MPRPRLAVLVAAAAAVLALLASGCSSGNSTSGSAAGGAYGGGGATNSSVPATTATGGGGTGTAALVAQGIQWNTDKLTFKAGEKVTLQVTSKDGIKHNFTFEQAKADADLDPGKHATVRFTAPGAGTYEFHCEYHPVKMKGTVTVPS